MEVEVSGESRVQLSRLHNCWHLVTLDVQLTVGSSAWRADARVMRLHVAAGVMLVDQRPGPAKTRHIVPALFSGEVNGRWLYDRGEHGIFVINSAPVLAALSLFSESWVVNVVGMVSLWRCKPCPSSRVPSPLLSLSMSTVDVARSQSTLRMLWLRC